jgi:EVE domain
MTADAPVEVTISFRLNSTSDLVESIAVRIALPAVEQHWSPADLDRAPRTGRESQDGSTVFSFDDAKIPVSAEQPVEGAAAPAKRDKDSARSRPSSPEEPATWIFQANWKFSDVSALRSLSEPVYLVRQFKQQIKRGDRVYLWECGRRGGIIALAEVLEAPRIQAEPLAQLRFIRDSARFAGDQLRVKLRLLKVIAPVIHRKYLLSRPELAKLSILRCPRGTNFRVTREQAEVLDKVVKKFEAFFPNWNGSREKRIVFAGG